MELKIGKHIYYPPGSFDELSNDQFLFFCHLASNKNSRSEILHKITFPFSKAPARIYFVMNEIQQKQVEESFSWIFSEVSTRTNKVPTFTINGTTYHGYSDNLENVLVKEWMVADHALTSYHRTKDESYLIKFIAASYRPHRTDGIVFGDLRIPFDEHRCIEEEDKIRKHLPAKYRLAILLNYIGIRSHTVKDFPNVFKGGGKGKDFGMPGMIHDMSGPELGTVKEIEDLWMIRNVFAIAEKNEQRKIENKKAA